MLRNLSEKGTLIGDKMAHTVSEGQFQGWPYDTRKVGSRMVTDHGHGLYSVRSMLTGNVALVRAIDHEDAAMVAKGGV